MTAEIGILSRTGVALAADSAVTVGSTGAQKIYNSANKLFSLSKNHPVGIMIYGNANFMGVPWEIIFKEYRRKLNNTKYETLEQYCNDFFDFLTSDDRFVTDISEALLVKRIFNIYFSEVLNRANRPINEKYGSDPTEDQVSEVLVDLVEEAVIKCQTIDDIDKLDDTYRDIFLNEHRESISEIISTHINFDIKPELRASIEKFATYIFSKKIFSDKVTGIVFAGYGEKDIFPSLFEYNVEGIFCGELKYDKGDVTVIASEDSNGKTTASIRAFAQREMVYSFMRGIDPALSQSMISALESLHEQFPEVIENELGKTFTDQEKEIIRKTGRELIKYFSNEIEEVQQTDYIAPILGIVDILPKEELAAMAEALVNLTSFKRKISIQAETVGGPIDVAVITKGDGLIWIKRKHYFKPELNYNFIQNNMRKDEEDV